jgi:sugar lactone lactonase YvrE
MPWLGTHLTMPMILLTGWYFGRIFERLELRRFLDRGWLYLILLPVLFVTLLHVASPYLLGQSPFGLTQAQLAQTGQWLSTVVISAVLIFIIYRLASSEEGGWLHLWRMFSVAFFASLAVITFRSAWMASFINYDYATEYLVYAHGAPAIKTVLNELEELSVRTTDGKDMIFAYDNEVSWPYSWYFRDFPNAVYTGPNPSLQRINNAVAVVVGDANRAKVEPLLEDRYIEFEYIRLWWPMQDYFGLTAERIASVFDFSPENPTAALTRRGIFDIWWSRDYTTYGEAVSRDFNVTRWPVSDRMHVYIRRDIAAQIWPYGVGDGAVVTGETAPVSQCNANFQQLYASILFQPPPLPLSFPRGVSVGPDGRIYVVEEGTHRVSIFDKDGNFLTTLGQQGTGDVAGVFFNRPNGISISSTGDIIVADTWNYRIQRFNAAGELLSRWGKAGEFGWDAQTDPVDGLWGPRDVAVDAQGRVYVADTGNKRVRVYTSDGQFIQDIGSPGSALGQLDEPVGLAIHPDGRLFVADTWNRRISVFNTNGIALNTFNVRGWYDELGNRPYLALDVPRSLLYVTDPDGGRILVYDLAGNCIGSFGQYNRENPDTSQFATVGGIAVDGDGNVYVADAGAGRILKFAPFPLPQPASVNQPGASPLEVTVEITDEVSPAETMEVTSEVTEPPSE